LQVKRLEGRFRGLGCGFL